MRLPGAHVTFTTRQGGVSVGPYESLNLGILTADDPEHVTENRRRAAAQAGVEAERVAMGWQVHGTDLKEWTGPPPDRAYAQPGDKDLEKVDGHLTREPGIGLLVLVADCYPVALSDGEQVAMLHCGWRPLAGGIIEKAVSRFAGVPAAAVGPGIGGCCYEVGDEVLEAFSGIEEAATGHMLDLRAVISAQLAAAGVSDVEHVDRCTSCSRTCTSHTAATTASPAARRASSCAMDPERVRRNLERVREQIGSEVEILAAVKYVEAADLPALAEAGIELVGENRAQELLEKQEAHGDLFTWDFIGQLQSRKVKDVAPHVRLIHSLASESALSKLAQYPAKEVLVQVNVAGEDEKAGIAPDALADFIARCPVPVTGLMTMPPFVEKAEENRRHFARLAELAGEHGLARLSMGTSQDYEVAAQEGATIVRLGSVLYD